MDWFEDEEMMRQWEDARKEEEKITMRKMEGKSLQVEGVQTAPELPVSQVLMKEEEPKKEMKKSKVAGWSTEKMDEKARKQALKTLKKWCNGGASIKKKSTLCGKDCRNI